MGTPIIKVWLREPRLAWKNDGGPVPRGMRSLVKRTGLRTHSLIIKSTGDRVRRGHWLVRVGGSAFAFSPADMKRLYSRVPL